MDLLYEGGLSWMRYSVSDTAEYGDYTRGRRIVTEGTRAEMNRILEEIRSGAFAEEWLAEAREGAPFLLSQRKREQHQPIEEVGRELRQMMPDPAGTAVMRHRTAGGRWLALSRPGGPGG